MKKAAIIALLILLCFCLSACNSSDYKEATALFNDGNYEAAQIIFESLGDYKNSQTFAQDCSYNLGAEAFDLGDYANAVAYFDALEDYKDSADLAKECRYNTALILLGVKADPLSDAAQSTASDVLYSSYTDEEKEEAIAILEELGDYKDCAEMLEKLNTRHAYECAVELFESGSLEDAEVAFSGIPEDYEDTDRYLSAIEILKKIEGEWWNGVYMGEKNAREDVMINAVLTIAPPYDISNYSLFNDCDWSVRADVKLEIDQMFIGGYNAGAQTSFTVRGEECAVHNEASGENQLDITFLMINEDYGHTVYNSRLGDYSKIFVSDSASTADETRLRLSETPYSLDWSTSYNDGGTMDLYKIEE